MCLFSQGNSFLTPPGIPLLALLIFFSPRRLARRLFRISFLIPYQLSPSSSSVMFLSLAHLYRCPPHPPHFEDFLALCAPQILDAASFLCEEVASPPCILTTPILLGIPSYLFILPCAFFSRFRATSVVRVLFL